MCNWESDLYFFLKSQYLGSELCKRDRKSTPSSQRSTLLDTLPQCLGRCTTRTPPLTKMKFYMAVRTTMLHLVLDGNVCTTTIRLKWNTLIPYDESLNSKPNFQLSLTLGNHPTTLRCLFPVNLTLRHHIHINLCHHALFSHFILPSATSNFHFFSTRLFK